MNVVLQVGGCEDCCYDFRAAGAVGVGISGTAIAHDCSLGVAGVIAEDRAAWTEPVERIPFFSLDEPSRPPGASKIFQLAVEEVAPEVAWTGRERAPRFSALAEAYDPPYDVVWTGVVLGPFERRDDCGVFRLSNVGVTGGRGEGALIPSWSLVDGAERQAFSDRSDFGVLNLDARGVEPRFGGSYGVLVPSMGDGQVALEGLRLPEALTLPALSPLRREPPGELTLTWTGSGADPLRILLTRRADAVTRGLDYYVACEVTDDGTFTIPAAALQHVPLGPWTSRCSGAMSRAVPLVVSHASSSRRCKLRQCGQRTRPHGVHAGHGLCRAARRSTRSHPRAQPLRRDAHRRVLTVMRSMRATFRSRQSHRGNRRTKVRVQPKVAPVGLHGPAESSSIGDGGGAATLGDDARAQACALQRGATKGVHDAHVFIAMEFGMVTRARVRLGRRDVIRIGCPVFGECGPLAHALRSQPGVRSGCESSWPQLSRLGDSLSAVEPRISGDGEPCSGHGAPRHRTTAWGLVPAHGDG
jgi:hypothetical protein